MWVLARSAKTQSFLGNAASGWVGGNPLGVSKKPVLHPCSSQLKVRTGSRAHGPILLPLSLKVVHPASVPIYYTDMLASLQQRRPDRPKSTVWHPQQSPSHRVDSRHIFARHIFTRSKAIGLFVWVCPGLRCLGSSLKRFNSRLLLSLDHPSSNVAMSLL